MSGFVVDLSGNNPTGKPFDHYNRTNDGDPTSSITPEYAGERILDTTNGALYQAAGTTASSWLQLTF